MGTEKTDLPIGYTMERVSITLFSTLEGAERVEPDKQLESHIKTLHEHRDGEADKENPYLV